MDRRFWRALTALVLIALVAVVARARRRHPAEDAGVEATEPVLDTVLADRIRSRLGQLEHALDMPRVHVMVERHVAVLHGDVPDQAAAEAIEAAVQATPGVRGVESHLHVGLLPSDTRPSAAAVSPSRAYRRLVDAARHAGAGETAAPLAVRAVLGTFGEALPRHTREQLAAHLPGDAAGLLVPPRRSGAHRRPRAVYELLEDVILLDVFPPFRAPWVVTAVLGELHELVPDQAAVVSAALHDDMRLLWDDAAELRAEVRAG